MRTGAPSLVNASSLLRARSASAGATPSSALKRGGLRACGRCVRQETQLNAAEPVLLLWCFIILAATQMTEDAGDASLALCLLQKA